MNVCNTPLGRGPDGCVYSGELQSALRDAGHTKLTFQFRLTKGIVMDRHAGRNDRTGVAMDEVVLNGTNFRHAVEFSRSGSSRFGPLRPPWGNPIYVTQVVPQCQIRRGPFWASPVAGQRRTLATCGEVSPSRRFAPPRGNPRDASPSSAPRQIGGPAGCAPPPAGEEPQRTGPIVWLECPAGTASLP